MALKTWTGSAGGASPGASPIGSPQAASPSTGVQGPGGWHPTILYLIGLIVAETLVIGWILTFIGKV